MRPFCLFLVLLLAGCAAMNQTAGWHHESTATFSYSVPPSLHRNAADAAGSHVAQFSNDEMTVTFDDGAYAGGALDSLAKYPNYSSQTGLIHGLPVQIVTFDIPPGAGSRFGYAIAASFRDKGFTVYVHCRTKDDYQTANQIFKTVRSRLF